MELLSLIFSHPRLRFILSVTMAFYAAILYLTVVNSFYGLAFSAPFIYSAAVIIICVMILNPTASVSLANVAVTALDRVLTKNKVGWYLFLLTALNVAAFVYAVAAKKYWLLYFAPILFTALMFALAVAAILHEDNRREREHKKRLEGLVK